MLQRTARHRVAQGVALLDERSPGWDERVDPSRLGPDIQTGGVLAQVYGNFYTGLFRLNLIWDGDGKKHGFNARRRRSLRKQEVEWRRVVTARADTRFTESLRQRAAEREAEILAHAARVVDHWREYIAAGELALLLPARYALPSGRRPAEGRELVLTVPEQVPRELGDRQHLR